MPRDFESGEASASLRALALDRLFAGRSAEETLRIAIRDLFPGRIALVSSFGADSAALLALVAEVDRATPVLFLETEMLFPETLAYQRLLADMLGLTGVRLIRPGAAALAAEDPTGDLHRRDHDGCCDLRKTRPLEQALGGFTAWISGRKRHQSATRAELPVFEADAAGRIKLNPLAGWSASDVRRFRQEHRLPPHPLVAKGYPSIGCAPCTTPVAEGEDSRAGRWRGAEKTECGIHFVNGVPVRGPAPSQRGERP